MLQARDQVLEIAKENNSNIWTTCEGVWDFILTLDGDTGEKYFSVFLEQIDVQDMIDIENLQNFLSCDEFLTISPDISNLANRILENLIPQRVSQEAFYETLWEKIGDTSLLPNRSDQIAFLACLKIDPRIPYYQIGEGCTMGNEEYGKIVKKIKPDLNRAGFILFAPIRQKTQRASLLMELADGLQDEREKIVFWADVIARSRSISREKEPDKKG